MLRHFIYPAPAWVGSGVDVETTKGGAHLIHRRAPAGSRTVIYMHGNGSDLATIAPLVDLFTERGLGFAAVEYPGYGPASRQRITQEAILRAAREGLMHLMQEVAVTDLVLVGESLGSAVAAHLAAEGLLSDADGSGRLVLISPFVSMTAVVQGVVRVVPKRLVPDRWETAAIAARIDLPTLLVHGSEDSLVPPAMSETLARLIPGARRVVIPGREHNTLWEAPSECLQVVADFACG